VTGSDLWLLRCFARDSLLRIQKLWDARLEKIRDALFTAGNFSAIIVKQNASIAGAIGGCQAEIGTACSMAAAGLVRA
jgi:L-serine dehydratase